MPGCTRQSDCPLFERFIISGSANIWRRLYCDKEEKFKTCARYEAGVNGRTVPVNLLPNGQLLRSMRMGADDVC